MNKPSPITQKFLPNSDYIILSWRDLESALELIANPSKHPNIVETMATLQARNNEVGPKRTVLTLVAAIAWLTDGGPDSNHD